MFCYHKPSDIGSVPNTRGSPPDASLMLPVTYVVTRYIMVIAVKFMGMSVYSGLCRNLSQE